MCNSTVSVNQSCGSLSQNAACQLSWLINATGTIGQSWNIDANFTFSDSRVISNDTANAIISMISFGARR